MHKYAQIKQTLTTKKALDGAEIVLLAYLNSDPLFNDKPDFAAAVVTTLDAHLDHQKAQERISNARRKIENAELQIFRNHFQNVAQLQAQHFNNENTNDQSSEQPQLIHQEPLQTTEVETQDHNQTFQQHYEHQDGV